MAAPVCAQSKRNSIDRLRFGKHGMRFSLGGQFGRRAIRVGRGQDSKCPRGPPAANNPVRLWRGSISPVHLLATAPFALPARRTSGRDSPAKAGFAYLLITL